MIKGILPRDILLEIIALMAPKFGPYIYNTMLMGTAAGAYASSHDDVKHA